MSSCLQVLSDPRQKRFFKAKDMADLFTLGDEYAPQTETADMFASLNGEVTAPEDPEAGQIARTQAGPVILRLLTSMKQQGTVTRCSAWHCTPLLCRDTAQHTSMACVTCTQAMIGAWLLAGPGSCCSGFHSRCPGGEHSK